MMLHGVINVDGIHGHRDLSVLSPLTDRLANRFASAPAEDTSDVPDIVGIEYFVQCAERRVGPSNPARSRVCRDSLVAWYKHAIEKIQDVVRGLYEVDEGIQQVRCRADELYQLWLQEQDVQLRKPIQKELAGITHQLFQHEDSCRRAVLEASRSVRARYNALAARISRWNSRGTSLLPWIGSTRSNRARRARLAMQQSCDEEAWDLEGAFEVECDMCAETKAQALLACKISSEVLAKNSQDSSLNDAFSLGPSNAAFLPATSLCICCASFLVSRGTPCPYTRQQVATFFPVVKFSMVNMVRLAANASCWLFEGRAMGIEWQALLAVFDAARQKGRSRMPALEFLETQYMPHLRANFGGCEKRGKPLCRAISDVFRPAGVRIEGELLVFANLEGLFVALRSKSVTSISCLGRLGIRSGAVESAQAVNDVVNRVLLKTIVSRFRRWRSDREHSRRQEIEELPRLLEADLFEVKGFPVKGSGRVISSLASSNFLRTIFGKKFPSLLKSLGPARISLEMVTLLMYSLLTDLHSPPSTEAFIRRLAGKHPLLWLAFAFPSGVEAKEVEKLMAQRHQHVHSIEDYVHREVVPCFSPAHMRGPAVVCCGTCGTAFIHPEEIQDYLHASNEDVKQGIAQTVKTRRGQHFREVFASDSESGMVDSNSGHSNRHRAVATVIPRLLEQLENSWPEAPTRWMMLHVLAYFRRFPKGGQIHGPQFLSQLAACIWDYVEQSNRLREVQIRIAPDSVHSHMSFGERLSAEILYLAKRQLVPDAGINQAEHWLKVFPPVSLQNRDPLLLEELTRPVSMSELKVTHQKKRTLKAPEPTSCVGPPVRSFSKTFSKKLLKRAMKKNELPCPTLCSR